MVLDTAQISLSIGIGTLAAIVYALRVLVMLDRKLSKVMEHQGIREN